MWPSIWRHLLVKVLMRRWKISGHIRSAKWSSNRVAPLKKYALMATWWLHGAVNKKACYRLSSRLSSAHKACSGSSNWARTSDLRINRKPGSSKVYINQWVIDKNGKRVIFRVIDQKLQITIFPALSYILHSALSLGTRKLSHLAWGSN